MICRRSAKTVIQSFLRHAMRDGFFHADMHQGNLFVDAEGRLTAVDFGIMGRLGRMEQRFLAEVIFGFITRDYRRVAEVHFEAGYVPRHHAVEDFARALRAIGEPIHARPADQISMAKLLTLLFEVTALFDMKTRTELVLLQKTMVVVEGVARGARSEARHVVDGGARGALLDRRKSRAHRPARGRAPRRSLARQIRRRPCRPRCCGSKISSPSSNERRRAVSNFPKQRSTRSARRMRAPCAPAIWRFG